MSRTLVHRGYGENSDRHEEVEAVLAVSITTLPALDTLGAILAAVAVTNGLVWLIVTGLAVYATRQALRDAGAGEEAERIRALRLAVLRALLEALTRGSANRALPLPPDAAGRGNDAAGKKH